jgi:stalled ribosome rescue protein Dom34
MGMTVHRHAAVFIDHHEAKIYHVDLDSFDEKTIAAPHAHIHRHAKGATTEREHPDDLNRFFGDVARALKDAEQILLVGPSTAKLQFDNYAKANDHALASKIVGVETIDHPTDAQLVAYAKKHFHVGEPRVRR